MNKKKLKDTVPEFIADTGSKGIIRWIERMGNKLPHPYWIFVWICL